MRYAASISAPNIRTGGDGKRLSLKRISDSESCIGITGHYPDTANSQHLAGDIAFRFSRDAPEVRLSRLAAQLAYYDNYLAKASKTCSRVLTYKVLD